MYRGMVASSLLLTTLLSKFAQKMDVVPVRLGARGIAKQIFLGAREADTDIDYLRAFVELARAAG